MEKDLIRDFRIPNTEMKISVFDDSYLKLHTKNFNLVITNKVIMAVFLKGRKSGDKREYIDHFTFG